MSEAPRRVPFDPKKLAASFGVSLGEQDQISASAPEPDPRNLGASAIGHFADQLVAMVKRTPPKLQVEGIHALFNVQINGIFVSYKQPYTGATLGPDFGVDVFYNNIHVFEAEWSDDDEPKKVATFIPGAWVDLIQQAITARLSEPEDLTQSAEVEEQLAVLQLNSYFDI